MISPSLVEMVKGRWREFKREPSAMFFVILMPLVWMVILGLAFARPQAEHYKVALLTGPSPTEGELSSRLKGLLSAHPQVSMLTTPSPEEAGLWMRRGEVILALSAREGGGLTYRLDPTNPESARARGLVDDIVQRGLGRQDVISSVAVPIEAVGSRYIDFLIPGLLALSLWTTSLYGTGMTIVAQRRENLLKRYRATPMKPFEYILSHIIGRYLILGVEMATVLATGALFFGFRIQGTWLDFGLICVLATAAFAALAILCGSRPKNTATYSGLNNLLTLPMMLLAGVWYSRSHFPAWLASLSDYLPLTAAVEAMRKIALEGSSLSQLGFEVGVLAAYTVLATLAAVKIFKWY